MHYPPFSQNCPWYWLRHFGRPNVKWCEATLCQWAAEPTNTWSNIGYLLIGILICIWVKRKKQHDLGLFGPAVIIMGICSFLFHTSVTRFFQFFDFLGMNLMLSLLLSYNLVRLKKIQNQSVLFYLTLLTCIGSSSFFLLNLIHWPVQLSIIILMLVIFVTEYRCWVGRSEQYAYRHYCYALGFVVLAAMGSFVDITRIICNPQNHIIQGHAVWHVATAIAFWFFYKFYSQFDSGYRKS